MTAIPQSLEELIQARLQHLRVRHYAHSTLDSEGYYLGTFLRWAAERGLGRPHELTPDLAYTFQRWVHHQKDKNDKVWSAQYQHGLLSSLKRCFRWAHEQGMILGDPTGKLELPRYPQHLMANVLTTEELERVMVQPDTNTDAGLRDRAFLELLYATAIRRTEALKLRPEDLDLDRRVVWIRQGKGQKDRVVPISQRALDWIARYELTVREKWLLKNPQCEALFMSQRGKPWSDGTCNERIGRYMQEAVPEKGGNCHLIRHSVATLLLESGVDIRYIQSYLGHNSLTSTQRYTQVGLPNLRQMYQRHHPSAQELVPQHSVDPD